MPRQSRIDAHGALHHVIAGGIARKKIFFDETDREQFLDRLGSVLTETRTACFAWALIPNHFHLLLKTGTVSLSTVMRRFLTGYAVSFNRRHHRWGHLFQMGDSEFVRQSLSEANEQLERKYKLQSQGCDIDKIAGRVGRLMDIPVEQVFAAGKARQRVRARSLLCYFAVRQCGLTMVSLSNRLGISQTAVSRSVERGEKIAVENDFKMLPSQMFK